MFFAKKEATNHSRYRVKNLIGQEVYSISDFCMHIHVSKELNLGFLNPGIYFVVAENGKNRHARKVALSR